MGEPTPFPTTLLDTIADLVLVLDTSGRIEYANQAARAALGDADVLALPIPRVLQNAHGRAVRGETVAVDVVLSTAAAQRTVEFVFNPYQSGEGSVAAVVAVGRDVERRVRGGLERDHLFALVESASDFIGMADAEGRPFYVNPAGRRMMGLDDGATAIQETRIPDYYPADQHDLVEQQLLPALRDRGLWVGEIYFRNFRTGERIPVSDAHFTVRRPDSGELIGFGMIARDITETKRIEAALWETEARYRQLFNSIDEGFCIVEVIFDADGKAQDYRFLEVNNAFERQTGLVNAVGKRMRELAPAHEEHWFETYGRIAATGKPARFRLPAAALDDRWYDVYAFRTDAPEAHHVAILFKDISEQVRAMEVLRRTAALEALRVDLADTLRKLDDPVDIEGTAARLIGRHLQASRVNYAEVSGDGAYATVRVDYCDGVASSVGTHRLDDYGAALMQQFRDGRTVVVDNAAEDPRLTPAERAAAAASSIAAYVMVPLVKSGRPVAVVAAHQAEPRRWTNVEVSLLAETAERVWTAVERARADEAVRRSEERYRLMGRATNDVIWDWNLETDRLDWNDAVMAHIGLTPAQLGSTIEAWHGRIHPDDRERVVGGIRKAIDSGRQSWSDEYRFRRHDGSYATFLDRSYIARNPSGKPYRMIGSMLDLTERRRAEQALREAHDQLVESDRRKDEFLAMLAHELRNPLAAIYNTGLLLEKATDGTPQLHRYVEILQRRTATLCGLVDDLLDVSRVTRGLIELRRERVELATTVEHAVESTRTLLDGKRHALHLHLPSDPMPVIGDPMRLEQILVNLLTNAAKYTDPAGRIDITLERRDGSAEIRVRDNGIGFEPGIRERMFTLFGQAERGLDRADGGLGIGLTIVKQLVELHGGRIDAGSDGPGQGAEFTVTLPLAEAEQSEMSTDSAPPAPSARHKRVLVVDDSPDIADTLALLLEDSGHEVVVAYDGPSALQKAEQVAPDLVLLDIGLPEMDGYEVARRLRENAATSGVVLVALTGYGQAGDRARTTAAGFDAHFVKPVDIDALEAFVNGADVCTAGAARSR